MLFLREFAADEALEGFREEGMREVAGAHFGDVADHVIFDRGERDTAEKVCGLVSDSGAMFYLVGVNCTKESGCCFGGFEEGLGVNATVWTNCDI